MQWNHYGATKQGYYRFLREVYGFRALEAWERSCRLFQALSTPQE